MSEKPEPQSAAKTATLPTDELFLQLINWPLYSRFSVGDKREEQIKDLRLHKGKFDMYCPSCKKDTTWTPIVWEGLATQVRTGSRSSDDWLEQFRLRIVCGRTTAHEADFYFEVLGPNLRERLEYASAGQKEQLQPTTLLKVGQFPSLSDFQIGDLR